MRSAVRWAIALIAICLIAGCAGRKTKPGAPDATRTRSSTSTSAPLHDDTSRHQSDRYRDRHDSTPNVSKVDIAALPEPVPKIEPRSRYGNKPSYAVLGRTYHVLPSAQGYSERGLASWYGNKFHGYMTSSLEPYDMYAFSAAHKTLPLPTYVRVTNLANGKSVIVRANDRGPFVENRIIDLSYAAAVRIGIWPKGTGMVQVDAIDPEHPRNAPKPPSIQAGSHIYLQLGAFGGRDNAERLAQGVRRAGIKPVRVEPARVGTRVLYRVRVGPLANANAADRMSARIEKVGFGRPGVVIDR